MSKERRKKRFFDVFDFGEEDFLFGQEPVAVGSGYSMSVSYDENGRPVVQVETYGNVDAEKLRKDVERQYPGAKIEGLQKQPLIRIVDEEEEKEKQAKKGKNR